MSSTILTVRLAIIAGTALLVPDQINAQVSEIRKSRWMGKLPALFPRRSMISRRK